MGCDIHMYTEKFNENTSAWEPVSGRNPTIDDYRTWAKKARENGDKERADRLEEDAFKIETGVTLKEALERMERYYPKKDRENDPDLQEEYESELNSSSDFYAPMRYSNWLYNGRNYNLFAILANVRNGIGFAGVDTGDGFVPVSMPKDLPADVSDYVRRESDRWDGDGHSHSYFTVKELLDYDWHQVTTQRGFVGEDGYETYKKNGRPDYYSGGVSGGNVVHVTNVEMEMILSDPSQKEPGKSYYTQVSWNESYFEAVGSFYSHTLPILKDLAGDHPDKVRIVFWFDN